MSNIPPLTPINVPEDIKVTDVDLYSKNFCRAFGDINSDAERTKPIQTLDMVTNWPDKLEIEQYSGYNKKWSKPLIEAVLVNGNVPKGYEVKSYSEDNCNVNVLVETPNSINEMGMYINGEAFEYNI